MRKVTASHIDDDDEGKLDYAILRATNGGKKLYSINEDGSIVVRSSAKLDYEVQMIDKRCSTLTVEARDRGIVGTDLGDDLSDRLLPKLTKVCIADVNEAPETAGSGHRFMIPADMPLEQEQEPITAVDEDEGDGIYYSIRTQDPFNVVEQTEADGNITTYSGVFGIDSTGQVYLCASEVRCRGRGHGPSDISDRLAGDGAKTEHLIEVEILPGSKYGADIRR